MVACTYALERMIRPIAILGVLAGIATAHHSASHYGSFYRERYLICTDATAATRVHCVGPVKAHDTLHAALHVGDLAPGRNHDDETNGVADATIAASYFNVRDVVPELRELLKIRLEPRDRGEHSLFDKQGVRAEAASGLAHLGDTASAAAIAELVGEFEHDGYGSLWDDTLAALALIDPARASRYALDFLGRTTDFKMSMPGGSDKLIALDYLRADEHPEAVLEQLARREEHGYDPAYCRFQAARVRFDAAWHANVRKQLLASYSGTWLAGCANAILATFGSDADDAAALIRHLGRDDTGMDFGVTNLAYQRILELIEKLPAGDPARGVLHKGLAERSAWPHVAKPSHPNYSLHFVAFHRAALAGLGDAEARTALFALIDDPAEHEGNAWLAAYWALRLRLPGAADHAGALIVRGVGYANGDRRGVFENLRAHVLDVFAERFPDDPRWTVLLLDGETLSLASEQAMAKLSRHPPPKTCATVTAAAKHAATVAANHAFLALTVLGTTCLPELEQLADDATALSEVRGAALEIVAALESPRLCAHLAIARRDHVWEPAIERATTLHGTTCAKVGHGDQPLPPHVYHQGL